MNTFHELTAKTLVICQQAKPDVQLPTGFMYIRVEQPVETG